MSEHTHSFTYGTGVPEWVIFDQAIVQFGAKKVIQTALKLKTDDAIKILNELNAKNRNT